jgi:hypothetical protein
MKFKKKQVGHKKYKSIDHAYMVQKIMKSKRTEKELDKELQRLLHRDN